MKNKEKFASEIVEIATSGNGLIAIKKSTGKPVPCFQFSCEKCALHVRGRACSDTRREWSESEYKEPVTAERLYSKFLKMCGDKSCRDCKYTESRECHLSWVLEHYNITEKGASE